MLVLLSLILMATTVFPTINVTQFALIGGGVLAVALLALRRLDAARQPRRAAR